ncbi:hypothetical protein ACIQ1J_34225 [Streptomyces sp. NPDC097107]|uniref:WXG100 family type VII secretion target n=1 Tax=Streptomyces sp. NPDC097107 TaxID=3366089 RepID=UPI003822BF44
MSDKQHEADHDRVSQQNAVADLTRGLEERPSFGIFGRMLQSAVESTPLGSALRGRTNFESHDLNEMVDLVEQANPEDLESSGKALWDARDAIKEAAEELDGHIGNVRWVGEAGEAFRKWGRSLVTSTHGLSAFAGGVGDQITAAAVGLADVRKAMPKRDTRPTSKALRPEQLPAPMQVEGNSDYEAAVIVEKNRQEAINQMNRLSSYYAVSEELLAGLEPPTFTAMPDVGVPKPSRGSFKTPSAARHVSGVQGGGGGSPDGTSSTVLENRAAPQYADGRGNSPDGVTRQTVYPDVPVSTTIDSVGTPTLPTAPFSGHSLPTTLPPADGAGPTGPFGSGYGTPLAPGRPGRAAGGSDRVRTPFSAQGPVTPGSGGGGGSGPGRPGNQGSFNQVGRPTPTGQHEAKGGTSGAKSPPLGHGVSGGTPRANPTMAPGPTSGPVTGAGRAGGVVGGRPASTPGRAGQSGPRLPHGTVVGAQAGSQSGKGRSATTPGITGVPAGLRTAAGAERNGMTRGGAGLVRGPGGPRHRGDERREEGTRRPDYLVEEEETHLPTNPRRDVPPVVN